MLDSAKRAFNYPFYSIYLKKIYVCQKINLLKWKEIIKFLT